MEFNESLTELLGTIISLYTASSIASKELLYGITAVFITSFSLVFQNYLHGRNSLKKIELTHQSQLMTASISSLQEICHAIGNFLNEANEFVSPWGSPNGEQRKEQANKFSESLHATKIILNKNYIFIKPAAYQNIKELLNNANCEAMKFSFGVMNGDTDFQRLEGNGWPEIMKAVQGLSGELEKIQIEFRKDIGFKDD